MTARLRIVAPAQPGQRDPGQSVAIVRPEGVDDRLRRRISSRGVLVDALAELDRQIAADARAFADQQGLTVRPSLAQLRTMLGIAR